MSFITKTKREQMSLRSGRGLRGSRLATRYRSVICLQMNSNSSTIFCY
jgi:hypothetical protein